MRELQELEKEIDNMINKLEEVTALAEHQKEQIEEKDRTIDQLKALLLKQNETLKRQTLQLQKLSQNSLNSKDD